MKNLNVIFEYGKTVKPDEMQPNAIYLDGACQGPHIDNGKRSYSFDHHDNCLRFATLATCQQVQTALDLGFDPEGHAIHINALDADTSFSLWLLLNHRDALHSNRVREMCQRIGFVDAHGPVAQPDQLHLCLSRNPKVPQTQEMVWEDQAIIDRWHANEPLPEPSSLPPAPAFGLDTGGNLLSFDSAANFAALYKAGCLVGVMCPATPGNTIGYSVGKRSDFVNFDLKGLLNHLATIEAGWGGSTTIGGAPRREGGLRSALSVSDLQEIMIQRWPR